MSNNLVNFDAGVIANSGIAPTGTNQGGRKNRAATTHNYIKQASVTNASTNMVSGVAGLVIVIDWYRLTISGNAAIAVAGQIQTQMNWNTDLILLDAPYIPGAAPANPLALAMDSGFIIAPPGGFNPHMHSGIDSSGQNFGFTLNTALTAGSANVVFGYHYEYKVTALGGVVG